MQVTEKELRVNNTTMDTSEWIDLMRQLTDPATKRPSESKIEALTPLIKARAVRYQIGLKRPIIACFVSNDLRDEVQAAGYLEGYGNESYDYWIRPEQQVNFKQRESFVGSEKPDNSSVQKKVEGWSADEFNAHLNSKLGEIVQAPVREKVYSVNSPEVLSGKHNPSPASILPLTEILNRNSTGLATNRPQVEPPDYKALGDQLRIRPDEAIPVPPVCLSIRQGGYISTFGTLGNFSVLIGKAKSRKTSLVSIFVAAAIMQFVVMNRVGGSFPVDKRTVLVFDTEQSRYHVLNVTKRICRLADQSSPANLLVYSLRSLPTLKRLGFIEWCINNTPNVGLVVIDGIRDLVQDINDNAEATVRTGDLLRWTEERNIHILTVIHMNKGNDQIRGSIGTELQNKAETVVSISIDPNDKSISVVTAEMCRDKGFEPFAFSIDDQGLPYIVEDWEPDQRLASRKVAKADELPKAPRTITPSQLTTSQHETILRRAFTGKDPAIYKVTYLRIKTAAEYFGYSFGESKAKEFLTYYKEAQYFNTDTSGKYPLYSFNATRLESNEPTSPDDECDVSV